MKTKLLILLLCIAVVFASCDKTNVESSWESQENTSNESSQNESVEESSDDISQSSVDLDIYREELINLIEFDKKIIEMFVCGSLTQYAEYDPNDIGAISLYEDSEYENFMVIEEMLENTYFYESGTINKYLEYPEYGTKSISSYIGKTLISVHYIKDFTEYIDPQTLKITGKEDNIIFADGFSQNGFEYNLSFTLTESGLLLNDSIYFLFEENKDKTENLYKTGEMDFGSCTVLDGKCLIINIFLDDKVSKWDEDSINDVLEMLGAGVDFLIVESENFNLKGLDIDITNKFDSLFLSTNNKITTDINNFVWIELLFMETIYGTLQNYVQSNFNLDKYDNYCVFIHMNKKGVSYTIPCNIENNDYDLYYTERGVLFYSTDKSYDYYITPATYAHELLHLFGAIDFYEPYLEGYEYDLMNSYVYNEIMLRINEDIKLSEISPLTAFKIGWENYLNEQFIKILYGGEVMG